MKKLFLISSYCDTVEKKQVLKNNLRLIKNLGYESLLLSPIYLEKDVIDLCDYYYQTKDNPVSSIEEKTYIHWSMVENSEGEKYRLERFFPDYGWAALYQNKVLSQLGITMNYDIYYHIIYDTKIDEGLIREILSNKFNCYYSNKSTGGFINEFCLHFLPLDRNGIFSFESYLNKERYMSSHSLIHDYMLKWTQENNFSKESYIVDEHINYYTDINFFSIFDEDYLKLFFEKDEKNREKNKLIVYDIKVDAFEIIINNISINEKILEKIPLQTNYLTSEIFKIELRVGDKTYDCTDNYNKIGRTKIFYL